MAASSAREILADETIDDRCPLALARGRSSSELELMIVLLNVSIRSAAGRQPKCDEVRDWDLRCESVTERRIGLCRRRKNVILEEEARGKDPLNALYRR
jgi:hypothetical protein